MVILEDSFTAWEKVRSIDERFCSFESLPKAQKKRKTDLNQHDQRKDTTESQSLDKKKEAYHYHKKYLNF